MSNYYDLVKQQKGQTGVTTGQILENQTELDKRMQIDADLLHLDRYKLVDSSGKSVPGIINVTLNRPAVYAANVISSLGNAKQQCVVESNNKQVDTHLIESFLDAAVAMADRRLWKRGLPTLNPFADVQLCLRGRHARRVLLRQDKGRVVSDIMPWDARYVYYEHGEDGLKWAAYETIRDKADVEADYGLEAASKAVNNECTVLDVWDDEINEVWIDGEKARIKGVDGKERYEQVHGFGFCPVVLQVVQLGYGRMLLDRQWHKYDGESIFFMIRDIVPEMNRLVSILQTLNMNQVKAALQYQNPQGSPQDEPPDRPEMGDVISVGGGKLEPVNLGEARVAAQMMYQVMEKAFQEGSYSDIDLGTVQQPFSAVALITIGENKDMIYMPRLAAKEMLNKAMAEMLIQQALKIGGAIQIGLPGHEESFPTTKLQGQYDISYKYFVKSPKIDIARMSLADAAAKWYPREYIYSTVLQVEDPDGMARDWYSQMAEMVFPDVLKHRIITSALDKAEENNDKEAALEAKIMAMEMGMALDQVKQGNMKPPVTQQPGQGTGVPLMPAGGKTGGIGAPISNPPLPPVSLPKE